MLSSLFYKNNIINDLKILPDTILNTIKYCDNILNNYIHFFDNFNSCFILGKGISKYISKEGSLKIKEISYTL